MKINKFQTRDESWMVFLDIKIFNIECAKLLMIKHK